MAHHMNVTVRVLFLFVWLGLVTFLQAQFIDQLIEARSFKMRILRDGSITQVAFIAGSANGLSKPDNAVSSQSEGIIPVSPKKVWNATGLEPAANAKEISGHEQPLETLEAEQVPAIR